MKNEKKKFNTSEIFTLALQNHQKNNLKTAENFYRETINLNSNHSESYFLLGTLLAQRKNFNEAKQLLNRAIEIHPNYPDAYYNLGNIQRELGDIKKAINSFQKTIELQPNYVEAHHSLGLMFIELGELKKAINSFQKTIELQPNYADAHQNLGLALTELGENEKAITSFYKAIKINPKHQNAVKNLSILLKHLRLNNFGQFDINSLKELFLFLFRKNDIEHKDIFYNSKLFLLLEKKIKETKQIFDLKSLLMENAIIKNLLKEELFLLMLQKTLISDFFLEKILTKLRYEILLFCKDTNKNILNEYFYFIISLAKQCFLNEYIFVKSKKENEYLNLLKNKIENDKKVNELEIAVIGCYIPLNSSDNIVAKLLNYKSEKNLFNDLVNMQVREPLKEKQLMNSFKSLGEISDPVSKKVRDQYEKYPYPRWRYTYINSPVNLLDILVNQLKLKKILPEKFNNPNILIAGCGTGKHIFLAKNYKNSNILAIDLSLASLAYSKRKVEEVGLKNIEFLHADILQLENLNRKFDIIESEGVLHHMQDPIKGLKILTNLLESHGILKLGLYSKIARQHIIAAREFIKKKNFKDTINDIQICREAIYNEKENLNLKKVLASTDFYSISSVRDLIFHVQEHCFTLPQISKILSNLNLEFLGMSSSSINKEFSKKFPDDKSKTSLDKWNELEINNPKIFSEMYNFWVRKEQ